MNTPEVLETDDAPQDDDYAYLPNEDGIDEDGQNVFCPGPY